MAGLNCRVLGEDINLVVQSVCNNVFVYSYLLRVLMISTSFAILLATCFATCVGVINEQSIEERYEEQ